MRGAVTDLDVHQSAAARRVSVQAADARAAGALTRCAEGVAAWRDGWKDALGRAGKRPKRVQPDPTVLVAMRDDLLALIDRAVVERRMSAVRASL
ncbi:hypothetical protein [Brevundimonas sp.]|uniref:hypothetical protein n=1 Tax=Brevundimonas sp. TaxID=1871086 RepID=UPI0035660895